MAESGEIGLEMGLDRFAKDRDYPNKNSSEMKRGSLSSNSGLFRANSPDGFREGVCLSRVLFFEL